MFPIRSSLGNMDVYAVYRDVSSVLRVSVFVNFFCESISLHKTYTVCYYVEQPRELFLCTCLTKRYEVLKQTRLVASHCGSHEVCIYCILVRVFEQPQVAHHR